MEEPEKKKKTKFNGGIFFIERLHRICTALTTIKADPPLNVNPTTKQEIYNQLLFSLFSELYPLMNDKQKVYHTKGFKAVLSKEVKSFEDVFIWECELRDLIEDFGLLMPNIDGINEALEN